MKTNQWYRNCTQVSENHFNAVGVMTPIASASPIFLTASANSALAANDRLEEAIQKYEEERKPQTWNITQQLLYDDAGKFSYSATATCEGQQPITRTNNNGYSSCHSNIMTAIRQLSKQTSRPVVDDDEDYEEDCDDDEN